MIDIPDADILAAYEAAVAYAKRRGRGRLDITERLIDAATDAVLWCRAKCTNATSFRRFCGRTTERAVKRVERRECGAAANRPAVGTLSEDAARVVEARSEKPAAPLLIEDLPEELAFAVRLYFVDGYTLREIGLLVGQSPNTVDLHIKKAAHLLAEGRIKPSRRNGEKRLRNG